MPCCTTKSLFLKRATQTPSGCTLYFHPCFQPSSPLYLPCQAQQTPPFSWHVLLTSEPMVAFFCLNSPDLAVLLENLLFLSPKTQLTPLLSMPPGSVSSRLTPGLAPGQLPGTVPRATTLLLPLSPHGMGFVQFRLPERLWAPLGHLAHLCCPGLWHTVGVGKSPFTQRACAHTLSGFRQALCVSRELETKGQENGMGVRRPEN